MAKVTILIEPEDEHEGEYDHKVAMTKANVVLLDDLVQFYSDAAKGSGWVFNELGVFE